jgi:hypothetical protein
MNKSPKQSNVCFIEKAPNQLARAFTLVSAVPIQCSWSAWCAAYVTFRLPTSGGDSKREPLLMEPNRLSCFLGYRVPTLVWTRRVDSDRQK